MMLEVELWQLVTLAISVLAGFWTLTKIIATQGQRHLDERFAVQELTRAQNHGQMADRLDRIEAVNQKDSVGWQRVERDLLKLQAEMPLHYVRREDYIRGQSVIEAKLDALGSKLESAQLRAALKTPH